MIPVKKVLLSAVSAMAVLVLASGVTAQTEKPKSDIAQLALSIAGDSGSSMIRAERLVGWVNDNFEWTSTDYKKRTVEEILANRHGNCAEQARVLRALFEAAGIECRWVAEINIQPVNEDRQSFAESLVVAKGITCSVFGRMHNDHRWLEVYDDSLEVWIPSDATLGIWGTKQWVEVRMGFGERPELAGNMIVPFVVIVRDGTNIIEDRSEAYLIDRFNAFYDSQLQTLPAWADWKESVRQLSEKGRKAFAGELNLHEFNDLMETHLAAYMRLKEQYLKQ